MTEAPRAPDSKHTARSIAPRGSRVRRGPRLASIALVAMASSAVTAVLGLFGGLGWLDAAMLSVVGRTGAIPAGYDLAATSSVSVVDIDFDTYEKAFGGVSPLDRKPLADLVTAIVRTQPAVLAIDIDVAPQSAEAHRLNAPLDDALVTAAQAGVKLVLALPGDDEREAPADALRWIARLRAAAGPAATIEFASTKVREHLGSVVRHDRRSVSLASEARTFAELPTVERDFVPLLPGALSPITLAEISWRVAWSAGAWQLEPPVRRAPIVLLGGSYDPLDRFRTVFGSQSGLGIHAATILSLDPNASAFPRPPLVLGSYLGELVLGVLLAMLWHEAWGWYSRAATSPVPSGLRGKIGAAAALWGRLGVFVVLVIGPAILLVVLAARPFAAGVWINPGPMILGLFVDALRHRTERDGHAESPGSWREVFAGDREHALVLGPLAALGIACTAWEAFH